MKKILPLLAALALFACACTAESEPKPRILWIDAPANFSSYANDADSIARDCKRIAGMGFTHIVVDVRPTCGDVLFRSDTAPQLRQMPGWTQGGWGLRERTACFDYLQAFIDSGHAAGLKVNVWTVDRVEDFERVKAMGVDFITTNARFPNNL